MQNFENPKTLAKGLTSCVAGDVVNQLICCLRLVLRGLMRVKKLVGNPPPLVSQQGIGSLLLEDESWKIFKSPSFGGAPDI